jgi:hypothetical protein
MATPVQHLDAIMETLLSCLCEAVSGNPNPPQKCCFRIGEQVAHDADLFSDLCCEGLAYVALGDIYPVFGPFPEPGEVDQANRACSFPSWAINVRMGILRCTPVGTDTTMPTCAEWNTAAFQQIYDVQSLATAACCFKRSWVAAQPGMSVVIGTNSTTVPEGGCVERFIGMQIQTINCPDC